MKKLIFSLLFLFSAECAFSQYDFYTQMLLAGQALMQQVNAQQQAQFQQMTSNFWSDHPAGQSQSTNSNFWSDHPAGQSQSTNYNSNTSNNSNSTSNSSTNTSNSSTEKQQSKRWHVETVWVDCFSCHGSGKCRTCDGKGWYWGGLSGLDKLLCPNCTNHDGVCIHCGGKGKRPKEKREYY